MNKESSLLSIILKKKFLFILIIVALIIAIPVSVYHYGSETYTSYKSMNQLKEDVKQKQKDLDDIIEKNKKQAEANKKAATKPFFKIQGNEDVRTAYAPLFENIITIIKQYGIRIKSITYIESLPGDSLIKNGEGAYSGCQVDFVLVGYYKQFANFLNELDVYPYFISINKFKITPYQYDKRILIGEASIVFYSKK